MDTFFKFLYDFLSQFFNGILDIVMGFVHGIAKIFNVKAYISVIDYYKADFNGPEWLFVVIAILLLLVLITGMILIAYFIIRKLIRFRKTIVEQESLLEEVGQLNNKVATLLKEKDEILAMKVSHLGINPKDAAAAAGVGGTAGASGANGAEGEEQEEDTGPTEAPRFSKLAALDEEFAIHSLWKNYVVILETLLLHN